MSMIIRQGGFLTTVQDLGRFGRQKFGVMVSGPMDETAFVTANLLLGNERGEAMFEMTLLGPEILFEEAATIALTGAKMQGTLNGFPVPAYRAVMVPAGSTLKLSGCSEGVRAYLAVAGGLAIPEVMGSASTLLRASFGGYEGRKLMAGDRIELKEPGKVLSGLSARRTADLVLLGGKKRGTETIRVIIGPQEERFTERGLETFLSAVYEVSQEADRMGYRLEGEKIEHVTDGNIITDGIAAGSIQVPSAGLPIIMMADRQCTGGYAKIATVISVDLPKVSQKKPGEKLRFAAVSVQEAQRLIKEREAHYQALERQIAAAVGAEISYHLTVDGRTYVVEIEPIEE
ncbi:MAG: biotin-dependent carboxyltransferase family protein [Lachnospiraceae bacterium]|nr:biotin-dependent carboxyltransferase family protein [Lachnospiraceae bacterium]